MRQRTSGLLSLMFASKWSPALTDAPTLQIADGDTRIFRPGGAWTVANVEIMERLCRDAQRQAPRAIDLSSVNAHESLTDAIARELTVRDHPADRALGAVESCRGRVQGHELLFGLREIAGLSAALHPMSPFELKVRHAFHVRATLVCAR